MKRSFWIKAHLLAAAFFFPALVLVATSGGLYLLGYKGEVAQKPVQTVPGVSIDPKSGTLESDVAAVLAAAGVTPDFEYIKVDGDALITRPTSQPYYRLEMTGEGVAVSHNDPDLIKSLIELHNGHGPTMFKDFQKAMAGALLFILLSGTWLGLSSAGLRMTTVAASGSGLAVLLALILAP